MRTGWLLAVGLLLAIACSSQSTQNRTLTERERDSTLAASPLPGAGAVGKAMEVADSAAARRSRSLPEGP